MNIKRLLVMIVIFGILLIPLHGYCEEISLELLFPSQNLTIDKEFTVDIKVVNPSGMVGGEIYLDFDQNILTLLSYDLDISNVTDFKKLINEKNVNPIFIFGLNSDTDPLLGDKVIGKLKFKANNIGDGELKVKNNTVIITEDDNGNFSCNKVSSVPISYTVSKGGNLLGKINIDNTHILQQIHIDILKNHTITSSTTPNQNGSFEIPNLAQGQYMLHISLEGYRDVYKEFTIENNMDTNIVIQMVKDTLGDLNGDGIITFADLVIAASYYKIDRDDNNWSENISKADVNDDGIIDVSDLVIINRSITNY
ncbi:carboxypeptidase regulatory-like domain-containing protein [Clostridiisalibacter paucivorans]|uniref:carboxypeptidase regulatory-like domain-containing protein n=1 Tax=Clostridiisalibacter paucivorans TaxID=408753 RepID=UPI00047E5A8B|nr:carboxypeptidase regulatory-like domain-containing protein [Clostridiisalibacter paucivorans]